MKKIFSGFTQKTAENLLLDAGAYFKNFNVEDDTFDTAVTAGKLLGATRGGGQFEAKPTFRTVDVDGIPGKAKGLQEIDSWEVKITANVLEVTKEGLETALAAAKVDSTTNQKYHILSAKSDVEDDDYIDNITWVGRKSGSNDPLIIQIYNALNTEGLTLQTQDKSEAVLAMTFEGHYDADSLEDAPFNIYYPKTITT